MSFTTPVDGQPAIAEHIAQLTETLSGTRAIPVTMQTLTVTSAANMPNQSISNVELASDTARANLLTNGGFEVWQRGSGSFTANSAYACDRWAIGIAGTDTFNVFRDISNVDTGSLASAGVAFTLGTGGGNSNFSQRVEDFNQLRGRTVSFSVRVRTTTANAVRLGIYDGTTTAFSSFHTGGGAYQTLTATLAVAGGATSLYTQVLFAVSCTAYLDNAMLVVGAVAADYAPLHPADDLARCQRYYEILGDPGAFDLIIRGWSGTGGVPLNQTFRYRSSKPVSPTLTKVGTWNVVNCGQLTMAGVSKDAVRVETTTSAANTDSWTANATTGNCITVEANP